MDCTYLCATRGLPGNGRSEGKEFTILTVWDPAVLGLENAVAVDDGVAGEAILAV